MSNQIDYTDSDIAVIGMSCRFPDAKNYNEFWQNLVKGKESVTFFSDDDLRKAGVDEEDLSNPNYVKSGVVLQDIEMFDASFFGLSSKEASIMDPQHRHFLECAWEALEDSGHVPEKFIGPIGVFGGCGMNAYFMFNILTNPKLVKQTGLFLLRHTGNDKDFLTTRVSYNFNLTGPSVNIQTACSTSLVAIHSAVQSLLNGECDLALAGGVTIELPQRRGYIYEEGEILSIDGHCRAFDHKSQGTIFGSGAGIVVLRRLGEAIENGDNIHAIIKSTAINNDGAMKVGYFAPSVDGQAQAISEAIAVANINPETITYVEAHGTGTFIGDPIEVTALTQAFRRYTQKKSFCRIGSVKSSIGHLDTAAGVAGFIKTVLSLKHKKIPASINFEKPNPNIDFENSPFFVNAELTDWENGGNPLRAGVSALGVGGTNAHVIIEEAPTIDSSPISKPCQLLIWSAKSKSSLDNTTKKYVEFFKNNTELNLADVSYTLQTGRKYFSHRQILVSKNFNESADALLANDDKKIVRGFHEGATPSIIFAFPGGGAQYPNMGLDLYIYEKVYREAVDNCLHLLKINFDINLRSLLFPEPDKIEFASLELQRPLNSVLSIFIVEYALAKLWTSFGIKPRAMIGHSMGEYAAACISGIMSLDDALFMVVLRGKIFEKMPEGGMLSVNLNEEDVKPYLNENLSIAVINGTELCVLAGTVEEIVNAEKRITEDGFDCSRVKISVAAHSKMLDPFLQEFREGLSKIKLQQPEIPIVSNVSGGWINNEEAVSSEYWVRQLRSTVRFADGLSTILNDSNQIFLETGPGNTLSSLVRSHHQKTSSHSVVSSLRHPQEVISDYEYFLKSVGRLWIAGLDIKWNLFRQGERRKKISLPTYSFDHQPYWIEPGKLVQSKDIQVDPLKKLKNLSDWFSKPVWKNTDVITYSETELKNSNEVWLILSEQSDLSRALVTKLKSLNQQTVIVYSGDEFSKSSDGVYVINTGIDEDYLKLIGELKKENILPNRIIHLWGICADDDVDSLSRLDEKLNLYFFSHLFLAKALGNEDFSSKIKWISVTNGMHRIKGETVNSSLKAVSLGPVKTIQKEFPEINCLSLDLEQNFDNAEAIEAILSEFNADFNKQVVAVRDDLRLVRSFEKYEIGTSSKNASLFKEGGLYIITGGLGGIALTLSKNLAVQFRPRLILISRKKLPEKSKWNKYLSSKNNHDGVGKILRELTELENLGAEVIFYSSDVTDENSMTNIFTSVKNKYGIINGIIHTAGAIDDGVIMFKKKEDAVSVLAPKVKGTLILNSLAQRHSCEFLILFSSASSILAPIGQIDYAAANAFMDAFANANFRKDGLKTIAINWGQWQSVGMAARIAQSLGIVDEEMKGEKSNHPLLGFKTKSNPNEIEFVNKLTSDEYWILNEHQSRKGEYIIPGTGYLELALASIADQTQNEAFEISDTFFLKPIMINNGEVVEIKTLLRKYKGGFEFTVSSRTDLLQNEWEENAHGNIKTFNHLIIDKTDLDKILQRCTSRHILTENSIDHHHMNFGPRWKNIRELYYGNHEAIALIELPSQYSADINSYIMHPALLDSATGCAQALAGFDLEKEFYLPFSYSKIVINKKIPGKFYSHIKFRRSGERNSNSNSASFDITIFDTEGKVIIDITEFMMMKSTLDSEGQLKSYQHHNNPEKMVEGSHNPINPRATGNKILQLGQKEGILPSEGIEVFNMILNDVRYPQYIVVSQNLNALYDNFIKSENSQNTNTEVSTDGESFRPRLSTDYVAPVSDLEKGIAEIWQEILGVDKIGMNDDFLELGGHSLLLTRIVMKVRKKFNVDLSLNNLFETPTIATFSREVEKAKKTGADSRVSVIAPVSRDQYRINKTN